VAGAKESEALRYLREDVLLHGPSHKARVEAALGKKGLTSIEDLAKVPPISLADVADPASIVLRPPAPKGTSSKAERTRRTLELSYKPVHWIVQDGVPIGSSEMDLRRLANMGARWLARCGVVSDDVVLGLLPAGPRLPYWELVLGTRQLAVPSVHLPPVPSDADMIRLRPSVVVGRPSDLVRLLDTAARPAKDTMWRSRVRLLVVAGDPLEDGLRTRLQSLLEAPGAAVVSAWAPSGVRALWWECQGATGMHTWPEAEVVQVVDPLSGTPVPPGADGEVVWTAVGWHGSVLVRLRTGVFAALDPAPCPSCGEPGPRLDVIPTAPGYLEVLDRHRGVAAWQAELRTVKGREELLVFLALSGRAGLERLLVDLDAHLSATQYVVLEKPDLERRLADHDDRRLVDLRT
jgi:hypothetical protein